VCASFEPLETVGSLLAAVVFVYAGLEVRGLHIIRKATACDVGKMGRSS
jgi:hypothetical protein